MSVGAEPPYVPVWAMSVCLHSVSDMSAPLGVLSNSLLPSLSSGRQLSGCRLSPLRFPLTLPEPTQTAKLLLLDSVDETV